MRVGAKGRLTIPKAIRQVTGLDEGVEIEAAASRDELTIRPTRTPPEPGRGQRIVEVLRGTRTANRHLTTDEIMRLLRGDN